MRFTNGAAERPLTSHTTAKAAFVALLARGFWPVGIYPRGVRRKGGKTEGKEPFGKAWGAERWTVDRAREFFRLHPGGGVGICLGPGRAPGGGWLIDAEGDGPEAEESRAELFGGESIETIGWGSVRGGHQLLAVDRERLLAILPKLAGAEVKNGPSPGVYHFDQLPGLEIRMGGVTADGGVKQLPSVAPPTPGTDGQARQWNGVEALADAPESFYATLEGIAATMAAKREGTSRFTVEAAGTNRPDAWLKKAISNAYGKVALAPTGERHAMVLSQTRTLAGYLHYQEQHGIGFSEAELETAMIRAANEAAPERSGDNPRCVRDAINNGKASPLRLDDALHALATGGKGGTNGKAGSNGQHHANGSTNGKHAENGDPTPRPERFKQLSDEDMGIVPASKVKPERVEWLVENRIARGKLNLLAGEGGDGKSQLAIAIAAAITTGGEILGAAVPIGDVFILAAEDGMRDTIVPRLIAAGADLARVEIVTAKVTMKDSSGKPFVSLMNFQDLDYWADIIRRRPNLLLIVADPIPAFLGRGVNDHKNADVRAVLEPFVDLLSEARVAMLGITHLGKSTDIRTPVHKILGSVAYSNLARSTHITVRDPEDKKRRYLCHPKVNIGEEQPTVAFRIEPHVFDCEGEEIKTSRAVFEEGTVDMDAAALMGGNRQGKAPGPTPEKTTEIAEWLFDLLSKDGGPIATYAIIDLAGEKGLIGTYKDGDWTGKRALYRAKDFIPQLGPPRGGKRILALEKTATVKFKRWQLVNHDAAF